MLIVTTFRAATAVLIFEGNKTATEHPFQMALFKTGLQKQMKMSNLLLQFLCLSPCGHVTKGMNVWHWCFHKVAFLVVCTPG